MSFPILEPCNRCHLRVGTRIRDRGDGFSSRALNRTAIVESLCERCLKIRHHISYIRHERNIWLLGYRAGEGFVAEMRG